jgi:membrane associated rhomboid family serine protease
MLVPESARLIFSLYGLTPRELTTGVPPHPFPVGVTLFTSMFVHGGLFHVAGNMLYLWIFGNNVEDAMGRARFVLFYLLSGLGAAFSQVLAGPNSTIPMVGASGAVSGVLGAYLLLYPHARVLTLIILGWFWRVVEIPALVVLGFWIVVQVVNGLWTFSFQGGGVAWFAHIGGFAAGMLLLPFFKQRTVPVRLFRR